VEKGVDVTLFATGDSQTAGKLEYVSKRSYEEDDSLDPKVWEALHIAHFFEQAEEYDLIHNHFDFLPLTYSRLVDTPMVTTIHGFSSQQILPVYKEYSDRSYYVSISDADRDPQLPYLATVYHGIDLESFEFAPERGDYLLYFGRIHPDKGTCEAIELSPGLSRMRSTTGSRWHLSLINSGWFMWGMWGLSGGISCWAELMHFCIPLISQNPLA